MIVTIDGPAGAGKSSIAKQVAEQIGFEFLDTGAMYRAITLGVIRQQIEFDNEQAIVGYARSADLRLEGNRVLLNGDDVTDEIRSPTVTAAIKCIADVREVRAILSNQQRVIARGRKMISDGRDQGTEVFPNAECKFFLTASSEERAKRRQEQLKCGGRLVPLDEILRAQDKRDLEDRMRPMGALRPADDAVIIHTDDMTIEDVVAQTLKEIRLRMPK